MKRLFIRGCSVCACLLLLCQLLMGQATTTAPAPSKVDAATKKLMAANGFFKQGLFSMAAREHSGFLTRYAAHENATAARYGLAICNYRVGRYPEAAKGLDEVLKDPKLTQQDEALAVLGHCRLSNKEYVKALTAFEKLLADHADSTHAEFATVCRLQALYMLGQVKEAAAAAKIFLTKRPQSGYSGTVQYYLALSQSSLGQHADSAETLATLLEKFPNSPYVLDATLLLGQCLENQGQLLKAAEQYRKMIKAAPPTRQAEGRYSLGVVLYKDGKHAEAITELKAVLAKFPTSKYAAPGKFQLGLAQLAAGKSTDARVTLADVAKTDKTRVQTAKYWLAQCDIAEKKYKEARAALDALAVVKPPPANAGAIAYDRAVCAAAMGQHQQGADEFAAFLEKYPASEFVADATYRRAFCLHRLTKYAASLALCDKLAGGKASAVTAPAAELATENRFLLGRYDQAGKEFEQLAESAKGDKALRFQLRRGQCAYFTGDFAGAIELLTPLAGNAKATKDAALREALFLLGDAQLQTKKYTEAVAALTKYLAGAAKRKVEAQYKLALSQLRLGQKPAAKTGFAAVMKETGDSPWVIRALFEYGQIMYNDGKAAEAGTALAKVLAGKAPDEIAAPAMYLLAWIDLDAKKYEAAAKGFSDLAEAYPNHGLVQEAGFQRAVCLRELGRHEPALAALEAYLKANPAGKHAVEARQLSAACLASTGEHAEAGKMLAKLAEDKDTCTDTVLYELAWSQRELRQASAAAKTYRRLLDEYPESKLITRGRAELAELLDIKKEYTDAAELLELVVADTKADAKTLSVALYRLGLCYLKLDDKTKAAAAFAKFAAQYAKDENVPSALYQAGAAYAALGELAEAQKHLAALLAKYAKHELAAVTRLKLGEVQGGLNAYTESAATYTAFLTNHPDDKYAYLAKFGLGWAMENTKKYDDARKWYAQVIETHNGPTAARAQYQIGECHFKEGKFELAVGELLKVEIVYAYPKWSAPALYDAGMAFEQLKKFDEAKKQYALCVKKYQDSGPAALAAKRLKALEGSKP